MRWSESNVALRNRLKERAVKWAMLLGVGLAYFIIVRYTGFGIPCVFYELTGWKCVGCGITRMILSLLSLDWRAAFRYNSFLLVTGPFLLAYAIVSEIRYISKGNRDMGKWKAFLWGELALAIAFGVLRNLIAI